MPFLAVLLGWRFVPETVPGARRSGGPPLMGAVLAYAVIISAMVLTATGTGRWAGGHRRHVVRRQRLGARLQPLRPPAGATPAVIVMVTYHLGQLLLILGLRRLSRETAAPRQNDCSRVDSDVVQEQPFQVVSDFAPAGDQPKAIAELSEGIQRGDRFQTLLGITGSGKSATIAWTIEQVQKPTLILAPNKSLAAQLAQEMREFFPDNRVEYFVSYYDYYQPEAYIPSSDTYIEKDSSINDEIDRLRHSATAALLTRRDVIVVASVSCIYGMGSPEEYRGNMIDLSVGVDYDMRSILRRLVDLQFDRNDAVLGRGRFRVRGDTIEVHPSYEESVLRIEMFGDTVDRLTIDRPDHRRDAARAAAHADLPGHPLRRRRRADGPGDGQDRGRAAGAAGLVRGRGQAARGAAPAHAHAVRPRDDERGRLLQRHRELLDAHRRPRLRRAAVHPARLLPRRLPARHRREPRRPCRSCTGSTRATAAARTCSSSTASACRRRATTGR